MKNLQSKISFSDELLLSSMQKQVIQDYFWIFLRNDNNIEYQQEFYHEIL